LSLFLLNLSKIKQEDNYFSLNIALGRTIIGFAGYFSFIHNSKKRK